MKKIVRKLQLSADTVRVLAGEQLDRVAGGASALCYTIEPNPGCGPGSLGLVNGCCSTNYTKHYTCPTNC